MVFSLCAPRKCHPLEMHKRNGQRKKKEKQMNNRSNGMSRNQKDHRARYDIADTANQQEMSGISNVAREVDKRYSIDSG